MNENLICQGILLDSYNTMKPQHRISYCHIVILYQLRTY